MLETNRTRHFGIVVVAAVAAACRENDWKQLKRIGETCWWAFLAAAVAVVLVAFDIRP